MFIACIGTNDMRESISIVGAVLLCGLIPMAQASGVRSSTRTVASAAQIAVKQGSEKNIDLLQAPRKDNRSQIANCADVAAVRALMATVSGSDFAIQRRVLNST